LNTLKLISLTSVAIVLSLLGLCCYTTWKTQTDAVQFSQKAQRLEIGRANSGEVLKLVKSSDRRTNGGFDSCLPVGECTGTVYFDNIWLHRTHLAPLTSFSCRFDIENGILRERWLEMTSSNSGTGEKGTFVHEGMTTTFIGEMIRSPEEAYFKISGGRPARYLGVMVTPSTPADLRALAYNFNFNCLSKLGGCKTFEDMLPVLKRSDLYWGQDPWLHTSKQ
jgi:hypothetical protein